MQRTAQRTGPPRQHSRPHVPDVFAALVQPSARPPLGSPADPHVTLFLRVHALQAHAELEILELGRACGHFAVTIQRLHLGADD